MTLADLVHILEVFWPSVTVSAGLAVAAGVVGVFVLLKRQALAALTMPQAVAVGVALALRLSWPTLPTAMLAVLLLILLVVSAGGSAHGEALLAAGYVGALSVAMVIIAHSGQHLAEVQNRFVGMDVAVDEADALTVTPILVLLGCIGAAAWRRWMLISLAPASAELSGLRPRRWEYGFLLLLAVVVLLGTHAVGMVMVLALLFLPAATVLPWARRLPQALAVAVLVGLLLVAAGFVVSNAMLWPMSQSVGACGFAAMLLSRLIAVIRR